MRKTYSGWLSRHWWQSDEGTDEQTTKDQAKERFMDQSIGIAWTELEAIYTELTGYLYTKEEEAGMSARRIIKYAARFILLLGVGMSVGWGISSAWWIPVVSIAGGVLIVLALGNKWPYT